MDLDKSTTFWYFYFINLLIKFIYAFIADENDDRLKILEERVYQQNDEIKSLRITVDDLVQR